MRTKKILLLIFLFFCHSTMAYEEKNIRWKILSETWSEKNEVDYQDFIHTLGVARKNNRCRTINDCLKSPNANPSYYNKNPKNLESIYSDCADLPFVLRAYFSWMNNLPFSYPTDLVEANSFRPQLKDIRYSRFGNIITQKYYVNNGDNFNRIIQNITDSISTASFRTNASKNDSGKLFRDTYPVSIDRQSIIPGTVLYDPNGHVAIVYEVTKNGKVHLIDAHPDNSLTTITYGEKFARTNEKIGGGFSNFRPFSMIDDKIAAKPNSELPSYSLIQFQKGPFIFKGEQLSYYEYLRRSLSDGEISYDPINEFGEIMDEICQDVVYREQAVNLAIKANIYLEQHPEKLPENIYGAESEWENFATPSRDARLKASVREGKEFLTKIIQGYFTSTLNVNFNGSDIVRDLRELYLKKSNNCKIIVSQNNTINLDFILNHLFDLSFDPYHCAELRWGLLNNKNCSIDSNKLAWYKAEQGLRNRIERDYSIKTNYNVTSLPDAPVSKIDKPDLLFDNLLEIIR